VTCLTYTDAPVETRYKRREQMRDQRIVLVYGYTYRLAKPACGQSYDYDRAKLADKLKFPLYLDELLHLGAIRFIYSQLRLFLRFLSGRTPPSVYCVPLALKLNESAQQTLPLKFDPQPISRMID
jgi:hypothetical protein